MRLVTPTHSIAQRVPDDDRPRHPRRPHQEAPRRVRRPVFDSPATIHAKTRRQRLQCLLADLS